jgi:nitrite reductase/ring-hydroxylating ferredoxin subunit
VAAGVVAAIPGLVDLFGVVPPRSSAKTRAIRHALSNVAALTLFVASWILREDGQASVGTLMLQAVGLVVMSSAAWMGGTLVYRNQIGVDHRYASAGKWQEISVARTGDRVAVADSDDLQRDQMKLVHAGDTRIVIARTEHGCRAFADHCTHKGGPLADGVLICGTVQCPWHGSQFDVHTGEVKSGPAKEPMATYHVEEANGQIRLGV